MLDKPMDTQKIQIFGCANLQQYTVKLLSNVQDKLPVWHHSLRTKQILLILHSSLFASLSDQRCLDALPCFESLVKMLIPLIFLLVLNLFASVLPAGKSRLLDRLQLITYDLLIYFSVSCNALFNQVLTCICCLTLYKRLC